MNLSRGQRVKLSDISSSNKIIIKISAENTKNSPFDISCFGLDSQDKCSDDRYMIFYNQKISPCKSIKMLDSDKKNTEIFEIEINSLPENIKKLVFTATIDGNAVMSDLKNCLMELGDNSIVRSQFVLKSNDFENEKSIIVGELYLKNEWRIAAAGFGLNGGLSALLEYFGIEEEFNDSSIESINQENINSVSQNNEPDKNKFSDFIKNILSSPFKYGQKKKDELKEISEKRERERNEYNDKILKQQSFKNLLINFLSDGILTEIEMKELEKYCVNNNISLIESLSFCNYEIEQFLRLMLANIISDNIVTDLEEESINSVCKFLNPSLNLKNEIESTLKRIKDIQLVKSGHVSPLENPKIITKTSEIVWHCEPNIRLIRQVRGKHISHNGDFFVTSDRLVFKSYDYPVEIPLKNILDIDSDASSLSLVGKSNKTSCEFRLYQGEMLGAYVEQALNKYHRKIDFSSHSKKSRSIPQTVRQEVWLRDQGQCIECYATDYLEYDHIIPFSKGGSNSTNNIQLLCRKCNLKKSDRI